ncbi:MAG: hypothetical protein WDM87_14360 [Terracidiphilus sp.]
MSFSFPKVYPILDVGTIPQAERAEFLRRLGAELAEAGVTLLEYRNKSGSDEELLADAAILRAAMPSPNIKLVLDDGSIWWSGPGLTACTWMRAMRRLQRRGDCLGPRELSAHLEAAKR